MGELVGEVSDPVIPDDIKGYPMYTVLKLAKRPQFTDPWNDRIIYFGSSEWGYFRPDGGHIKTFLYSDYQIQYGRSLLTNRSRERYPEADLDQYKFAIIPVTEARFLSDKDNHMLFIAEKDTYAKILQEWEKSKASWCKEWVNKLPQYRQSTVFKITKDLQKDEPNLSDEQAFMTAVEKYYAEIHKDRPEPMHGWG